MPTVPLKVIHSDIHYRGQFNKTSFAFAPSVLPIFERFLTSFSVFGTSLGELRLEGGAGLPDLHLFCGLPKIGSVIRLYLNRVEMDFNRANQIGRETAIEVARRAWDIIHQVDTSIGFDRHEVTYDNHSVFVSGALKDFLDNFIRFPAVFNDKASGTVAFTFDGGIFGDDVLGGRVILERSVRPQAELFTKIDVRLNGSLELERIGDRAISFVSTMYEHLGARLE